MPPREASGTNLKPSKPAVKAKKTSKTKQPSTQSLVKDQAIQMYQPSVPRENSLYMLANEIIAMIFRQLGRPPKGSVYVIEDLQDIHPCYAICSTSNFLKQWYIKIMGKASNKIELTLQPSDYCETEVAVEQVIKDRLRLLGHEGLKRVSKCHIIGPYISRETGKPMLDRWLGSAHPTRRLEPEDKVLIKRHVEQDLVKKTVVVNNLMICVYNLFKRLESLRISPGELPFNVWDNGVHQYVLKKPERLTEFKYVQRSETAWKHCYWYLKQLTNSKYFPTRAEQASNYPKDYYVNKEGFADLQKVISGLLNAQQAIKNHKVVEQLRINGKVTIVYTR